ncbi:hypothetical protein SAMN02745866_03100 [Alteromonadaceae bacterium Bs31]|nr:hypothetical protein SAMN02745866_03100 [Alteromonadaceae bacterium Bs31]
MSEQQAITIREAKPCGGRDDTLFRFPIIFRSLGAIAVAVSAIIYLLQGLQGVDESLRHWVYLVIIAVLTSGGVVSQYFLKDSRGARLFFALAALLIPVQVTQLSAVLSTFVQESSATPLIELLASGVVSILFGAASTFLCLSIFARPYAKKLTFVFMILNCLLLLPYRDLLSLLIISASMFSLMILLYVKVLKNDHRFQLFESIVVHLMMWVPIVILFSRSGFQLSDAFGVCVLLMITASGIGAVCAFYITRGVLKTLLVFCAYLLALSSSAGMLVDLTLGHPAAINLPDTVVLYCFTLPPVLFALAAAELSDQRDFYRFLALPPLLALSVGSLFFLPEGEAALLITMLVLSALAIVVQSKALLLGSLLIAALSVIILAIDIVDSIESISWLAMACMGVLLLALSSVFERYGRTIQLHGVNRLARFQAWSF